MRSERQTVDPERWQTIERLFHQALDVPASHRAAWLQAACGDDAELRSEVHSLLQSDSDQPDEFLKRQVATAIVATAKQLDREDLPRMVGPYRLLQRIGRGGMGTVYLAERADGEFHKRVALKMVQPGMDTEFILARFRRERQVLAQFDHPHIGRLLDGGTNAEGAPYLVMEFIEGDWISRYCEQHDLDLKERLKLFLQVCKAVQYAHQQFVVHRDLKPGNILVDREGRPKLVDFGICKLLYRDSGERVKVPGTQGMVLMTPEYASPEQVRGEPVTIASDVYSLGAVLYELVTGVRPHRFDKLTPQAVEQVVCQQEIMPPSQAVAQSHARFAAQLRGDVDTIVLHALRKEPERRYETVHLLASDIRRHLAHIPIKARPESLRYAAGKFVRRHRLGVVVMAGIIAAFIAGGSMASLPFLGRSDGNSTRAGVEDHLIAPERRVQVLIDLGDSYARDRDWRNSLSAFQQARSELTAHTETPDAKVLRAKVESGIQEANSQLRTDQDGSRK
jgi:serine/threonine protein kinase